jgi:hypothetical protein
MRTPQRVLLTLDIDWAPDAAIDFVAEILVSRGVKATWFVTHDSPGVRRLRARPDLFELGIHPNFLPGSSHGRSGEGALVLHGPRPGRGEHADARARPVDAHALAWVDPAAPMPMRGTAASTRR